jgi:hypothetical protein
VKLTACSGYCDSTVRGISQDVSRCVLAEVTGKYLDVGHVPGRCFGSLKGLMEVCQYEVHPRDT